MKVKLLFIAVCGIGMWALIGYVYGNNITAYFPPLDFWRQPEINQPEDAYVYAGKNKNNTVQLALLLDTSGSMDGLIERAKSQLWNILNELARTQKDGEEISLEVALYEYGTSARAKDQTEINCLTGFTTDMDLISEKLFELTTSGSNEYCGLVINNALDELEWGNDDALKLIYIAGNEHFGQIYGRTHYEMSCRKAVENGVVVNTIYCGDYKSGIEEYWKQGAELGGGDYMAINQNEATVYVSTPYDDKIMRLNKKLNETYIPYGNKGRAKKQNQSLQDSNAMFYSQSNAVERAVFKNSKQYKTDDWDLASAYQNDKAILKNKSDLPENFRQMSEGKLEAEIAAIIAKREAVQKEIQELDVKRRAYKAAEKQKTTGVDMQGFVIHSLHRQAKAKGFEIEN